MKLYYKMEKEKVKKIVAYFMEMGWLDICDGMDGIVLDVYNIIRRCSMREDVCLDDQKLKDITYPEAAGAFAYLVQIEKSYRRSVDIRTISAEAFRCFYKALNLKRNHLEVSMLMKLYLNDFYNALYELSDNPAVLDEKNAVEQQIQTYMGKSNEKSIVRGSCMNELTLGEIMKSCAEKATSAWNMSQELEVYAEKIKQAHIIRARVFGYSFLVAFPKYLGLTTLEDKYGIEEPQFDWEDEAFWEEMCMELQ